MLEEHSGIGFRHAQSEGGVGLIDPVVETKALLGKIVVRSVQPLEAPWKILWRRRWKMWLPRQGGSWPSSPFWGLVPKMQVYPNVGDVCRVYVLLEL